MNRRILLQVAGPAVLIGLLLFGVCLFAAWQVNRLQAELTQILSSNVASMQAAQHLETSVRQLRFHSFLYALQPDPVLLREIERDQEAVEEWMDRADEVANTVEEKTAVASIRKGYAAFQKDMAKLRLDVGLGGPRVDLVRSAVLHPIQQVVEPCREYARINEEMMNEAARESARLSRWLEGAMLLLGIGGPISGLLSGFGIARGLSRSLYRLSVSVRDMAQSLETDVAAVRLTPDGDLGQLENQLHHVVERVAEVTQQLRRQEQEILRAQQLSAVGQLAASVAHEVRNPLTSIKMLVEAALREQKPRPFTQENLRVIHGEILKLEQTVQEFLDFARPPAPRKGVCDLREIAQRASDLIKARARQQRVEVEVETPEAPVEVEVDGGQLTSVLVNLLINALDAMPNGGRLSVSLQRTGEESQFQVRDTGIGIEAKMLERLFTPFVSTKETGSGLGLSISRRIVEDHGGTLSGGNHAEGGACFTLTLPCRASTGSRSRETSDVRMVP
ncbi:MAG: ATP-binding protein [Gemmataceae bacterium]